MWHRFCSHSRTLSRPSARRWRSVMVHLCQKLQRGPPLPCIYASTDDSEWDDETTDDAPRTDAESQDLDFIELNVQLRLDLGRRMTVALLDLPRAAPTPFHRSPPTLPPLPPLPR